MKEIRTTKLVEQTTVEFIANDGKKFTVDNAEQECKTYERRLNDEQVEKEFKKLNPIELPIPFIDWGGSVEARLINVPSQQVLLTTIMDYYASLSQWMCLEEFDNCKDKVTYPCDLVFVNGEEWVSIYTKGKDELKSEFNKVMELLK